MMKFFDWIANYFQSMTAAELTSIVIIAGAAVVFVVLERVVPYNKGQKVLREGFFDDFALYTIAQSYILSIIIFSGVIAAMDSWSGLSRLQLLASWPLWAQLVFFTVTHDIYIYWMHRWMHNNKYLWRLHEAHHSPRKVDWLSGSRSHALEILLNQTIEFMPIILLGASPEVVAYKGIISAVWGMYIHSNLNVRSGKLQFVINGPEMHRLHHTTGKGRNRNFATKLAIWDWLFGTAWLPNEKAQEYGLKTFVPDGYWKQFLFAFRTFAKSTPPTSSHFVSNINSRKTFESPPKESFGQDAKTPKVLLKNNARASLLLSFCISFHLSTYAQLNFPPIAGDNEFTAMNYPAAVASYDSLLRVTKDSTQVLWRLARVHICIGDVAEGDVSRDEYRKAEKYAQRAMQLDSSLSEVRTWYAAAIGSVALHEGGKVKVRSAWEIKRQVDIAIALNPKNDIAYSIVGSFHRSLADLSWIERSLAAVFVGKLPEGSFEEGEKALKKAIELNPQAPRHHYELGLLYLDWGKPEPAKEALRRSTSLPFVTMRDAQNKADAEKKLIEL